MNIFQKTCAHSPRCRIQTSAIRVIWIILSCSYTFSRAVLWRIGLIPAIMFLLAFLQFQPVTEALFLHINNKFPYCSDAPRESSISIARPQILTRQLQPFLMLWFFPCTWDITLQTKARSLCKHNSVCRCHIQFHLHIFAFTPRPTNQSSQKKPPSSLQSRTSFLFSTSLYHKR